MQRHSNKKQDTLTGGLRVQETQNMKVIKKRMKKEGLAGLLANRQLFGRGKASLTIAVPKDGGQDVYGITALGGQVRSLVSFSIRGAPENPAAMDGLIQMLVASLNPDGSKPAWMMIGTRG